MDSEYIDIHKSKQQFERSLAQFLADKTISDRNKEIVQRFLRDAALGKTLPHRSKKKVGYSRRWSYLKHLTPFLHYLQKDIDEITQEDMERFILALEGDEIRSQSLRRFGSSHVPSDEPLSDYYKVDIKVTVKKLYRWLLGKSKQYPELVEWIDTSVRRKEVPSLTSAEVERMIDHGRSVRDRALVQVLFDGGFRIGELLNVRLKHVQLVQLDPEDRDKSCFLIRVPYSKTLPRTVALPMRASTKWIKLWMEQHPARPILSPDGSVEAQDLSALFFQMSVSVAQQQISRLGREALGKRVYPHLLRHSSATYWSNRLPYFKFCKRFGWTMTSKMPHQYIDRAGLDELDSAREYLQREAKVGLTM